MNRRLLVVLITLVGSAAVVVAVLAVFFPEEDRTTVAQSGEVRSIEIDVEVGRVEIVPRAGQEAMVTRSRRYLVGAPRTRESLVEGVLRIEARCRAFVTAGCKVDYRVEAPAAVPIRIRTGRGSVSVTEMVGMVEVAAGGDVRLDRTQGPAKVDTSAGDVEGVDIVAQFLDATTKGGRISLSVVQAPGRLGLRTGAGDIDVSLPAVPGGYRVAADAGGGKADVSVELNEGGSRAIIATTGGGDIRIQPR